MSGQYVAVTKSSQFKDTDTEALDNIQFYRHKGGDRFKSVCENLRQKPSFAVIAVCFGVVFVAVLITIIALAVNRNVSEAPTMNRSESSYAKYKSKTYGLEFYPEPNDGSVLLNFRPMFHKSYAHYYNYLNGFLHEYIWYIYNDTNCKKFEKCMELTGVFKEYLTDMQKNYNIIYQQNPNKYADCNTDNAPGDKICKFASSQLGVCSTYHEYGYHEGNPCILFVLKLPPNSKAVPVPKGESELGNRWSPDNIGVSCKAATEEDEKNIGKTFVHNTPAIQYFPDKGFPTYFYRNLTGATHFLHPLVMVKFNTIADHHYVGINCTAWIKTVDDTKSEDFSTSFTFYMH